MNDCGHEAGRGRRDWDDVGRAAEDFARRLARDARRFADRLAGHASEFARDMGWQRPWRHEGACRPGTASDVRGILEGVRGVLGEVLDGVDELIGRIFPEPPAPGPAGWVRVTSNHQVTCVACGRPIGAGEECHLRRRADGRDFRCLACGPEPTPESAAG
jgi:hypothetical protein